MKLKSEGNNYSVNRLIKFSGLAINASFPAEAFDFAYDMAFGEGYHRDHRSGGLLSRSRVEIFRNTFQGKLAEIILYNELKKNNIEIETPDFNVYGKGLWDDADLIANGKYICVKSAAFFSNLLLLEAKDWDKEGRYIPNMGLKDTVHTYDYFVLVRIKPDVKSLFGDDVKDRNKFQDKLDTIEWWYDIPGCCSIKTIRHIIEKNYILPQHSILNNKTRMDAENFYIQSGDLKPLKNLYEALKQK
ncbi:hypothetical protein EON78_00295 [bacterium]|nr:MAG: hypothetical protein EON78_00295 [bacterium]